MNIYLFMTRLHICDFYNGVIVFRQRVRVKKTILAEKAELHTTKRRSLQQRPLVSPPRHVTAPFQNIHVFHRPFMSNMIREF